MMSRKIKDFKEIQDEFNNANYVYSKLDPQMFSQEAKMTTVSYQIPA